LLKSVAVPSTFNTFFQSHEPERNWSRIGAELEQDKTEKVFNRTDDDVEFLCDLFVVSFFICNFAAKKENASENE